MPWSASSSAPAHRYTFGSKAMAATRTADPYRDTDVIDARAPRTNQLAVGLVALAGALTGLWWLPALVALQLALGLTLGRRWCLACVAYFELIQPRWGEGPLEDARPPRFANLMGVVVLGTASVAYVAGAAVLGAVLGVLVAALALLSHAWPDRFATDPPRTSQPHGGRRRQNPNHWSQTPIKGGGARPAHSRCKRSHG